MVVAVKPEIEARLAELAAQTGQSTAEVVEDALTGYFDELLLVREMLDQRYDEIEQGKVEAIPGDEAFARLHANVEARRKSG